MHVIRYLGICTGILICSFFVEGQNFKEDIRSVQTELAVVKNFHTEIQISIYQNHSSLRPLMVKRSTIDKRADAFHYTIDQMEYVKNKHCALLIDHQDKSITLNKAKTDSFFLRQYGSIMGNIDSVLKAVDSVSFISKTDGVSHYRLYTSKNLIIKMEMLLDVEHKTIKKIIYYYDPRKVASNNKVTIEFNNTNMNSDAASGYFDEGKYVRIQKRKYVLTKEFKNYSLSLVK